MLDPRDLAKLIPEYPDGPVENSLPTPTPPKKRKMISEAAPQEAGGTPQKPVQPQVQPQAQPQVRPQQARPQQARPQNPQTPQFQNQEQFEQWFYTQYPPGTRLDQQTHNYVQSIADQVPGMDAMFLPAVRLAGGGVPTWVVENRHDRTERKISENDRRSISALADELTDDPLVWEATTKTGAHLLNKKGNKYDEYKPDAGEFDDKAKHNTPCDEKSKPGKGMTAKVNPGEGGKGGAKAGAAASAVPELKKVGNDPLRKKGEPTKSREPHQPGLGTPKYKAKGGPSESSSKGGVIGFKNPDILASVSGAPTDSQLQNLEETSDLSWRRMLERGLDPNSGDINDAGAMSAITGSERVPEDPGWEDVEPDDFDTSRVSSGGMRLPSPERPDYTELVDELPDAATRIVRTPEGQKRARFLNAPGPDPTRTLPHNIDDYDLTPEEMDEIERLVPGWTKRIGSAESDSPLPRPSPSDAFSLRRVPNFDFDELTNMSDSKEKRKKPISEGLAEFGDEEFEQPEDELLKPTPMSAKHIAWLQENLPESAEDLEDALALGDLLPLDELDKMDDRRTFAAGKLDDDKKRGKAVSEWEEEFVHPTNPTSGTMQDAIDSATAALKPDATAFKGIKDVIDFIKQRYPQFDAHEVVNRALHNK